MKKSRKFVYLSLYCMLVVTCFSIGIFAMTNQTVNAYYSIYYTYTPPTLDKALLQEKLTSNTTVTEVYFDKFNTEDRSDFTVGETTLQTADCNLLGDISENQDESILAYTDVESTKMYVLCTEKITFPVSCEAMFKNYSSLTKIQFENIDTKNVTRMYDMFYGCSALTSLTFPSDMDTSNVTSMSYLFYGCKLLTTLDLSMFDTTSTTFMAGMFYNCANLVNLDISNFNTSSVTSMHEMFMLCKSLVALNLSHFDTSKVQAMYYMFRNCSQLESLDLSSFDTSSIDTGTSKMGFNCMFHSCNKLTYLDLSSFNTKTVTNMAMMFLGCGKLTSLDISSFDTSNVTAMQGMFHGAGLATLDLSHFNTSKVTNMHQMFCGAALQSVDISSFDTSKVKNMAYMFRGGTTSTALTSIYVGDGWTTDALSTTEVSTLSFGTALGDTGMFMNCTKLPNWSTNGGVTDKTYAYAGGDGLGYLKYLSVLSNSGDNRFRAKALGASALVFDKYTSAGTYLVDGVNVIDGITGVDVSERMDGSVMLYLNGTTAYILAESVVVFPEDSSSLFFNMDAVASFAFNSIDTSKVTTMESMFENCQNKTLKSLDLTKFNTRNVTTMEKMFHACFYFEEIDVSSFDTRKVTTMYNMFYSCSALKTADLSNFETPNLESAISLFGACEALSMVDISGFSCEKLKSTYYMFHWCSKLSTIYVGSQWDPDNITSSSYMFTQCTMLPNFNSNYIDKTYAYAGEGGYLTYK